MHPPPSRGADSASVSGGRRFPNRGLRSACSPPPPPHPLVKNGTLTVVVQLQVAINVTPGYGVSVLELDLASSQRILNYGSTTFRLNLRFTASGK